MRGCIGCVEQYRLDVREQVDQARENKIHETRKELIIDV